MGAARILNGKRSSRIPNSIWKKRDARQDPLTGGQAQFVPPALRGAPAADIG
jgi:hypothetical protein